METELFGSDVLQEKFLRALPKKISKKVEGEIFKIKEIFQENLAQEIKNHRHISLSGSFSLQLFFKDGVSGFLTWSQLNYSKKRLRRKKETVWQLDSSGIILTALI